MRKIDINLELDNNENQQEIIENRALIITKTSKTEFNNFKDIINNKLIVYNTKLEELEKLVNVDEETIRQIKELLEIIEKENIPKRLEKIENIRIGDLFNPDARIFFKDMKFCYFDVNYFLSRANSETGEFAVSLQENFVNNIIKYNETVNENEDNPSFKVEETTINLGEKEFNVMELKLIKLKTFNKGTNSELYEYSIPLEKGSKYQIWISWLDENSSSEKHEFIYNEKGNFIEKHFNNKDGLYYTIKIVFFDEYCIFQRQFYQTKIETKIKKYGFIKEFYKLKGVKIYE